MASIAKRTLLNLFDCIRGFFLRGIENFATLYSDHNRYGHMQVEKMFAKPKSPGFRSQATKMLLNIPQSLQEVQQTATMALITASFKFPMSSGLLRNKCLSATMGFKMDFSVDDMGHIVPDVNSGEELSCSFVDSTSSYCYFIVEGNRNKNQHKPCLRDNMKMEDYKPKDGPSNYKDILDNEPTNIDITKFQLSRGRSLSECSDDNFICFIEDDIDCKASSSSSKNYGYYSNQYDSDEESLSSSEASSDESDEDCVMSSGKKVRFDLNPKVHVMHTWNFAYRNARKGNWENVARDRVRFHNRIQKTEEYLAPILEPEHRQRIYEARFSCDNSQLEPKTLDKPF